MTDWRDLLVESFHGNGASSNFDVAFVSGEDEVRLAIRAGRLRHGNGEKPDLEIRLHSLALRDVVLGKVGIEDVFGDAEMRASNGWGAPFPAGERELPARGSFDRIPGASLSVGISVSETVFGGIGMLEQWIDGRLVSSQLLPPNRLERPDLDVQMFCTLEQLAAIRRRELTPVEAIAAGVGVIAQWPQLACFMDLAAHPAFEAVWEDTDGIAAQAAWGATFSSSAYGDAALRAMLESSVAR